MRSSVECSRMLCWSTTAGCSAVVVFPDDSYPYNSVMRPLGRPFTPVCQSMARLPVDIPVTSRGVPIFRPVFFSNSASTSSTVLGIEVLLADHVGVVARGTWYVVGAVFFLHVDGPAGDQIGGAVVGGHLVGAAFPAIALGPIEQICGWGVTEAVGDRDDRSG